MKMTTMLSTAEVAAKLETTPRTLRKFLRDDAKTQGTTDTLPGKGSRYSIEAKQVRSLKSRFSKWETAQAEAKAERIAAKAETAPETAPDEVDELDTPDTDEGPSDDDLAAIDETDLELDD